MKFALMQPYFFPYLGYFALIQSVDRFVVFDQAQYMKGGWVNRNRILKPNGGWQYLTVPIRKQGLVTPINSTLVSSRLDWRGQLLRQIEHYARKAPNYSLVKDMLRETFSMSADTIDELNVNGLRVVCQYLGIKFNPEMFKAFNIDRKTINEPADWALTLARILNAHEYVNLPGGRDLYRGETFMQQDVAISFIDMEPLKYICDGYEYMPNLSILDVMMWSSPVEINAHLLKYATLRVAAV